MNTNNVFFNFCHPLLNKLNEGKTIKLGFKLFFWLIGCGSLLFAIYIMYNFFDSELYKTISYDSDYNPTSSFNIWSFLLLIAALFAHWIIFQIAWFRATMIAEIPDSRYIVSAIFAVFIRALGEIAATYLVVTGFVSGLVSLFSEVNHFTPMGEFGVAAVIAGPVAGFLVISLFYFLAERISALPEIAANTKKSN